MRVEGAAGPKRATTGPDGRYRVDALAGGEYRVHVDAPGLTLDGDTRVNVQGDTRLDLLLKPAPVSERIVVSATRGEAAGSALGVSVTALDRERILEREPSSFVDLLRDVPGMSVASSGAIGSITSAFVRGGESSFARVMIDGVPVNEPGGYYNFASQFPLELGRVEVVRGATSSLYGTDALAGVIHLVTRQAAEKLSGSAEAEAGEFSWARAKGSLAGRSGKLDWNAGLVYLNTDNEQPNSAFEQTAGILALGLQLTERTSARAFLRGETSSAGTPGAVAYGRPDLDATSDHDEIAGSFVLQHAGERASHALRAGIARTGQLSQNPLDSGSYTPSAGGRRRPSRVPTSRIRSATRTIRAGATVGYQLDAQLGASHLVSAGADLEHETGEIGDLRGALLSPRAPTSVAIVQDRIAVRSRLFLTLGGRVESNDSFGTRAVPRAAARCGSGRRRAPRRCAPARSRHQGAELPAELRRLRVRARATPTWWPSAAAPTTSGRAAGFSDRLRVEATFFHHDYHDQIAFTTISFAPFRGTYENLGRRAAEGSSWRSTPRPPRARASARSTRCSTARSSPAPARPAARPGQPLLRRPRHQGSLSASAGASRVSGGLNLLLVGSRTRQRLLRHRPDENEAYARARRAPARRGWCTASRPSRSPRTCSTASTRRCSATRRFGRALRFGVRCRQAASRDREACCWPGAAARTAPTRCTCCGNETTWRWWAC